MSIVHAITKTSGQFQHFDMKQNADYLQYHIFQKSGVGDFENFKLCTAKDKKNVYKKTCFSFFLRLLSIPSSDALRSVFLFIHFFTT